MPYLRIKFERQRRDITQAMVAVAARIAQPTLAQIERGRLTPTPKQLERLSNVFGVPADDLLKPVESPAHA